jgi:hypothetical protein
MTGNLRDIIGRNTIFYLPLSSIEYINRGISGTEITDRLCIKLGKSPVHRYGKQLLSWLWHQYALRFPIGDLI